MSMFQSGTFTTSTPLDHQDDSGFHGNYSWSRNSTQTPTTNNSASIYSPLKNNNISPYHRPMKLALKCKSENMSPYHWSIKETFNHIRYQVPDRGYSSKHETPRTSRIPATKDEPLHFRKATPLKRPRLFSSSTTAILKQENDSGFRDETPAQLGSHEHEQSATPQLTRFENLNQRNEQSKGKHTFLKRFLDVSRAEYRNDISTPELANLYRLYRFQKMGLKISSDFGFCKKQLPNHQIDSEMEMSLIKWKSELQHISSDLEDEIRIDFLSQLHMINANHIISEILSGLSGHDLQNASCVGKLWRKLILEDRDASRKRFVYLKEKLKIKMEKLKIVNPFQRPPNFGKLGSIENFQQNQKTQRY